MKQFSFLFVCFLLCTVAGFTETRYVINTSHSGAVKALVFHEPTQELLSGGEDGMMLVFNVETKKTVHSFRVSDYPIQAIAVHPEKSYTAILSATRNNFSISVWNWKTEQELYSLSYEKRPLYFNFSPQGTYFVVCDEDWKSLRFYNATSGSPISKFRSGFGIVSFFTFSSKETTFMTYQPTGKISYWNISNQKQLTEFSTDKSFQPAGISDDKRNIIGFSDNYVYLIDLSKGTLTNSIKLDSLVFTAVHPDGKSMVCFSRPAWGSSKLYYYKLENGKIIPGWNNTINKEVPVTSVTFSGDSVFTADKNGTILRYSASGRHEILFRNLLAKVSDISFSNDTLAIGTENNIVIIRSSFLAPHDDSEELTENELATFTRRSPFSNSDMGLSFFPEKGLFLWPKGKQAGILSLMEGDSFSHVKQCVSFNKPLIDMVFATPAYLSLESNGLTRVLAADTYKTDFQYTAQGINTAAVIDKNMFACGRSKASSYDSALMLVNTITGETTVLQETSDVIFDMKYDTGKKILYTLGFENRDNEYWTVIKKRSGHTFKNEAVIYSEKNDSTNSSLALDESTHTLYFSLGTNALYAYQDNAIKKLEKSPQLIRKIIVASDKLFSLNLDSSITVWDTKMAAVILHFYLFEDLSWILLTDTGNFFTQGNGDNYLNVFEGETSNEALLEKYRMKFRLFNRGKDSE